MGDEQATLHALNELRLKLDASISIEHEGFALQESVLMRLQYACLIAEVIHIARNRDDDLFPLVTGGRADHE